MIIPERDWKMPLKPGDKDSRESKAFMPRLEKVVVGT